MSQDPDLDKMLVLDALSSGLNISMAELLGILGRQAPISNLLLQPVIRPQQLPMTTTLLSIPSIHSQQKAAVHQTMAQVGEPQIMRKEFLITYWIALSLVSALAISAVWTKVHMAAQKGHKKFEPRKPMSDAERWHEQRQKVRDASVQMGQVDDQAPAT